MNKTQKPNDRNIPDKCKAVRTHQPKVNASIDVLVDKFLESDDYTGFKKYQRTKRNAKNGEQ